MKNIIVLVLIVLSLQNYAQEKRLIEVPKVDKRLELLSIVFRLAGNAEYNYTFFKKYTDKVESHFNAFKEHELITFARELRENKGISYDAVMSMAIVLDENLNPMIDFSTILPEKRWSKDDANKTNDNKSVVMEVQLMANQEYQFIKPASISKPPKDRIKTYEVNFKTKE